jgi:hypothetical protein
MPSDAKRHRTLPTPILLSARGAPPKRPPPSTFRIRIRPAARAIPFDRFALSNWLKGTLQYHRMRRVGDLDGFRFAELSRLRRFGRVQARALYHVLASHDFLEPAPRFSFVSPRPVRLAALAALSHEDLRAALTEGVAPFPVLRHIVLGVATGERATKVSTLPFPTTLQEKLRANGYVRLGDFHDVVLGDLLREPRPLGRGDLAVLHGMLRAQGALVAARPPFEVPAKWRKVPITDVAMPNPLYNALVARGLRKLGDLVRLTPARMGDKFGPVREAALFQLVRSLRA